MRRRLARKRAMQSISGRHDTGARIVHPGHASDLGLSLVRLCWRCGVQDQSVSGGYRPSTEKRQGSRREGIGRERGQDELAPAVHLSGVRVAGVVFVC